MNKCRSYELFKGEMELYIVTEDGKYWDIKSFYKIEDRRAIRLEKIKKLYGKKDM